MCERWTTLLGEWGGGEDGAGEDDEVSAATKSVIMQNVVSFKITL